MPLYSETCPLPKNQMLRRHQASTPFSPIDIAGISLWLKADAGTITEAEQFISQIVLSDAGTPEVDGTYTRASGGETNFSGSNGLSLDFQFSEPSEFGGTVFTFRVFFEGDPMYDIKILSNEIDSIFPLDGVAPDPTASTSLTATGNTLITAWADQSGNDFDVAPDYVSSDITWESSVAKFNNKPAILFGVANDNGYVGLFNNNTFITKSLFVVYSLESVDNFEYSIPYENNGINIYTSYGNGNQKFGGYFNGFFDANTDSTLGTAYIRTTIADDDGEGANPIDFYVNGQSDGSLNGDGFYNLRSQIVIGNGGAREAGPAPSINQPFQGYIAEIVAYDVVLTNSERQQVEAYLNTKYAIY